MKLRHAAAFALVGWYLMTPPHLRQKDQTIRPVSRWTVVAKFRAEKDCDAQRAKLSKVDPSLDTYRGLPPEEIYDAQCIASDDPRLKAK